MPAHQLRLQPKLICRSRRPKGSLSGHEPRLAWSGRSVLCTDLCTRRCETGMNGGDRGGRCPVTWRSVCPAWIALRSRSARVETGVVVLITQRSQVQILPPLPFTQVRGLSRFREGPSCCALCTGDCAQASAHPVGVAVAETSSHVLRLCATRETILLALLGIRPRGRRWVGVHTARAPASAASDGIGVRTLAAIPRLLPAASRFLQRGRVPGGVDDQGQLAGVGVHPVRGLAGVAGEATVDRAGFRPGRRSRLASGRGRCCQVTQGGRRSGSVTACSARLA